MTDNPQYLPTNRPPKYKKDFKYQCLVCLKGFKTEQGLKDHLVAKQHGRIIYRLKKVY